MMNIVKAGGEDLVWLVVALFWVIAQIAGAAARKKVQPPSLPREEGSEGGEEPADPLAELMRRLAGGQEFQLPHPAEREEPEFFEAAPSEEEEESPWKRAVALRNERMAKQGEVRPVPVKPALSAAAAAEEMKAHARPRMSAFRTALPSMKMPSLSLRIDLPSYTESSAGKQGLAGRVDLRDRKVLRRAMLSHIIFSPPKALEGIK